MRYIHQSPAWPAFHWSAADIAPILANTRHRQGLLLGEMRGIGLKAREEASLGALTDEVVKSSAIEGEVLDVEQVRSSLARRLGLDVAGLAPAERNVEGVVEMMINATQDFKSPLTEQRLFAWHGALFPTGRSGLSRINVAQWRNDHGGPMQVVAGPIGRGHVHFEAPTAAVLPGEMTAFLAWANQNEPADDPVIKAALAHLWFVTIHPFDDGNGRIARAIGELLLARADNSGQRFYSMSAQIRSERRHYYELLEATQKGSLDVTEWLVWFLQCLDRAFDRAERALADIFAKARYWDAVGKRPLNARQTKVLNRLLDGFEGKLTSSKWGAIAKCSQDTAARDIEQLVEYGLLRRGPGGGRSTHYELVATA